jgi:hypothetical protein
MLGAAVTRSRFRPFDQCRDVLGLIEQRRVDAELGAARSADELTSSRMLRLRPTIVPLAAAAALIGAVPLASAHAFAAHASSSCTVLAAPSSLGKTFLALHRAYERVQPDVHNPVITGPVGRVRLGVCGGERYAIATFDQKYNGVYFGATDQPERFIEPPGHAWRDIGNTGGDPCGTAPTALLKAWKIVTAC